MRYRFYTTSEEAWWAMLVAIGAAVRSVYMEMYILEDDQTGRNFLDALARKSREGVRTILIVDGFGSSALSSVRIQELRAAGVEVHFFSFWFRRTHRKLLILDEEVAFVGGVNVGRRFASWRDLEMRVVGRRLVRSIVRSFARVYRECGGNDPLLRAEEETRLLRRARTWFVEHGIGTKRSALRALYEERIDRANVSLAIVTPYFIPHRWFIAAVHRALARGVAVDLIVPARTDFRSADRINRHEIFLFASLGASCFLAKKMNHAKAILVDGREGIIGSQNLDALSFDWNAEAGLFFDDGRMVRDLGRIIEGWKKEAAPFDPIRDMLPWYDRLVALILRVFRPVL